MKKNTWNQVLSYEILRYTICEYVYSNISNTMKTLFVIMSILQTIYHLKLDFQNVDQYSGGKWLIQGTQTPHGQSVAKPGTPI